LAGTASTQIVSELLRAILGLTIVSDRRDFLDFHHGEFIGRRWAG
jgi:hypothetical protein